MTTKTNGWIPVAKRKPPKYTDVILAANGEGQTFVVKGQRLDDRYEVEDDTLPMWLFVGQAKITHWMPWPDHPTG